MTHLDKDDIAFINHRTVAEHGGNFMPPHNFLPEKNLDYLVEAVQADRAAVADVCRTIVSQPNR